VEGANAQPSHRQALDCYKAEQLRNVLETKLNGTRVGHGGSDPGVQTEMLSNLSKDIGVILFLNTSMSDQDVLKYHFAIFRELFKHAEALKEKGR